VPNRRFEVVNGPIEIEGGADRLVVVESKVKVSSEQSPVGLSIVVLDTRTASGWMEKDFERNRVVIRG
jgi:hypothetical protein